MNIATCSLHPDQVTFWVVKVEIRSGDDLVIDQGNWGQLGLANVVCTDIINIEDITTGVTQRTVDRSRVDLAFGWWLIEPF